MNQETAARHITRMMRSQFAQNTNGTVLMDPIRGAPIPLRYLVEVNKQAYNARGLLQWIDAQTNDHVTPAVPHTRQPFTSNQQHAVDSAFSRSHPTKVLRRREVVAGAVKHREVTRLIQHACLMAVIIQQLTTGKRTDSHRTIQDAYSDYLNFDIADRYLTGLGYRLQIEINLLSNTCKILPIRSYSQFARLPVTSFQEASNTSFYLVPISMQGETWSVALEDDKQGVIKMYEC